jgi:hypothetical protein
LGIFLISKIDSSTVAKSGKIVKVGNSGTVGVGDGDGDCVEVGAGVGIGVFGLGACEFGAVKKGVKVS